ncbi:MAG: hypothetical protein ACI9NN_001046 [Bacteroidia bacterium]|jgi:hypothetical protein
MSNVKEMWDNRYSSNEYAYGMAPNMFFKEAVGRFKLAGNILLPAEGEGRNAIYAAQNGLLVTAFDISKEGKKKALKLAAQQNVEIVYEVGDFLKLDLVNHNYDSAALIFAHFPPDLLSIYHKKIAEMVKPGGLIILEGFSKNHSEYQKKHPNIGGPKNKDILFSKEMIRNDFLDFEVIQLEVVETELEEGLYHRGKGSVIQFVGRKTNAFERE